MKKYRLFLIILIIIMIIPIIMKMVKTKHHVTYTKNNYNIEEKFSIKKKQHKYNITIKNKKETYTYTLLEKMNKRSKIIKEIKKYKEDNITCILPIYIKNIDNELYCLEDNKQVSAYYLKDNDNYKKILKKVKKYKVKQPTTSTKKVKYKKLDIYQKNIPDNYAFTVWNYKGIYIIKNNELKYQKFLDYDLYDNLLNAVTSRYYVLLENTSVDGIENIHYYDFKKDKYKVFKLEEKISKDSYINGVHDDLIYVTDKKKKVQYAINIKKEQIEEVGNEELSYIKYTNNKKELLNKSDFFLEEVYFNNNFTTKKDINSSEVIEENEYLYFREDNNFYNQLNKNNILLFSLDNIKEWKVYDRDIILLRENAVYLYNDNIGLNKIIEYNELNYNYKNIIKMWK